MPSMKAGTLKPAIDQLKKTIAEKGDSLSPEERRATAHRLKRMQRKSRRIRLLEEARTPAPKAKTEEAAPEVKVAEAAPKAAPEAKAAEATPEPKADEAKPKAAEATPEPKAAEATPEAKADEAKPEEGAKAPAE